MPTRLILASLALALPLLATPLAGVFETTTPLPADSGGADLTQAVCPVVYQLDPSPGARGYHYIFYGNAFFINRDGYLLTAAHVLSEFHNGGQPSILVHLADAPPRMLKVTVIAIDATHDVAILKATPSPFTAPYAVAALPLATKDLAIGDRLVIQALRPENPKDPETFQLPRSENYSATVIDYHTMALDPHPQNSVSLVATPSREKSPGQNAERVAAESSQSSLAARSIAAAQVQTDLALFSHEVLRGQSGAPVLNAASHQVAGLIEGRWLHPSATSAGATATQGAAVPIHYAQALLEKNHIRWDGSNP